LPSDMVLEIGYLLLLWFLGMGISETSFSIFLALV